MQDTDIEVATHGGAFLTSKVLKVSELVVVFVVGLSVIICGSAMFGDSMAIYLGSIWAANLLMLAIAYLGLRWRGQSWAHFGLATHIGGWRSIIQAVLQSIPVFVLAVAAFVAGAILMANLFGMPEGADTSRYEYLQGNLGLILLALASVYVVSAFAEEVIYRAFLITRITELFGGGNREAQSMWLSQALNPSIRSPAISPRSPQTWL